MSNLNDEQLLEDEDGEDEYDLGNDEEEALLADDCDAEQELHHGNVNYMKKNSGRKKIIYSENKIYREADEPLEEDVLELDDCESDLDNTEYADELDYTDAQDGIDHEAQHGDEMQYEDELGKSLPLESDVANNEITNSDIGHQDGGAVADSDEHLQSQSREEEEGRKESEDEEEEDDKQEGRERFKSERTTMISLKGNKSFGNIPDTLDGLVTVEEKQEGGGNRWKRGGRGGFSRGGFRGNQRGYNSNFGPRRKQMQGQNRQSNQNVVFPHQRLEGSSDSLNSLIPSPFLPSSHKIHINPHFRGNVQPQSEAPIWNENIGNLPPSNSGNQHPPFHDAPRFPPPSMGFNNIDHRDMQVNMIDHHRQQRQRTPPPQNLFHSSDRSAGYDTSPGHLDYHREPYESHATPMPEAWMNPPQRLQESSIGPPGGHHHQFGGGHQHFSNNHMHNERGSGEVLQHFRPTMQPGPLFSHVTSVAPPAIPQQNLMLQQQQHIQNLMRSVPPLHNAGLGQMLQHPPQESHNRIPPPGFSPNDGRPVPSLLHGPPSPWQEQPVNRSSLGGQHLSMVQQQQQHPGFHQGGPRSFPVERGNNLQGPPLHQIPHSSTSMSAPPPFHSANIPQGPPPHPMHQQHPQGQLRQNTFNPPSMGPSANSGPSSGRFPRQGAGNFQSPGFNRNAPPQQQGNRPNRGGGHMTPGRGGLGPRRGIAPSVRPLPPQKPTNEEVFPPKRPSGPLEGAAQTLKLSPPKKRKLRKIVKSNLHEVETVDTLPDTTTINEKETPGKEKDSLSTTDGSVKPEDSALLEYQRKIEQQKRMREKFLQQKEQRRKLTALQKQKELQEKAALSGETSHEVPKGNAIATIVNRNPVEPTPSTVIVKKEPVPIPPFVNPTTPDNQLTQPQRVAAQKKALMALKNAGGQTNSPRQQMSRGVPTRGIGPRRVAAQPMRMQNPVPVGNPQPTSGNIIQQGGQTYKIIQVKNEQGQVVHKKVLIRQGMAGRGGVTGRGQVLEVNPQQIRPIGQGRGNIAVKRGAQVAGAGHRLVQVLSVQQQGHPQTQESKILPSNMLLQRVVKQNVPVAPQQQQPGRKVVVQNVSGSGDGPTVEGKRRGTVVVENLAASTSEADLRKMCQSVGQVLNVQMVPNLRRAIVEFAYPASAVTFFQRYQRKIVDLSMISVRLANS